MSNLSRKNKNLYKKNREKTVDEIMKSREWRSMVIQRNDPHLRHLKERYEYEQYVQDKANELYDKFKSAGATWAACVQAVKTDSISYLTHKFGSKLKENTRNQKQD